MAIVRGAFIHLIRPSLIQAWNDVYDLEFLDPDIDYHHQLMWEAEDNLPYWSCQSGFVRYGCSASGIPHGTNGNPNKSG
jgi:hypothetical protein